MAWTAPMTAVLNATLTAAQWNAQIRDNMNETEAAKATTPGRYFTSQGTNSIAEHSWYVAYDSRSRDTNSTTYTTIYGGPQVSGYTGTTATVFFNCAMGNETSGAEAWCSVAVSGASTVAASDAWGLAVDGIAASTSTDNLVRLAGFHRFTGLTAGYNVFTMQYRVSSSWGWFAQRAIQVMEC